MSRGRSVGGKAEHGSGAEREGRHEDGTRGEGEPWPGYEPGAAPEFRERLGRVLEGRRPFRLQDDVAEARAAVTLLLRDGPEALFVRRTQVDGDPWSGQVALPGGRREPGDGSLRETARRELREETAIELEGREFLGRLDEIRPLSRQLPSVAVTPFIAWLQRPQPIRTNRELDDHAWIPVAALRDPARRSTLDLEREARRLTFPTIRYRDYTIWGLTFEIVKDFLWLVERRAGNPEREPRDERP